MDYIAPGASWTYANTDAAHVIVNTAGFELPGFDDSAWFTGNAPFGNTGGGDFGANTNWDADYDPQVRTTFTLASPTALTAEIGVDNGYALYINGNLVSANNAEGFTYRWEYSVNIPASFFVAGSNLVALQLEDHGGLTAFDMHLFGPDVAAVPEPGSLLTGAILGGGLFLGLMRGRRRKG